jgi:hypothetical protein
MTTTQVLKLDDGRHSGRARADERHSGCRYVISKAKDKRRSEDYERLKERMI